MTQVLPDQPAVLVVDDNPLILNVLKSLFASEGYQVFSSTNGQEALEVLDHKTVDLIICDVMMPMMDGYELHHSVREKSELSHIPFVFLTALGDKVEVNQGRETGADDYIVKPFDPKELLSLAKGKILRSTRLKNLVEERYDAYRKKVIHTLSHEFRTPLVAINTGTELLLDQHGHLDSRRAQNVLEAIKRGGQRLERLVSDFMLLQQIEGGVAQRLFENRKVIRSVSEITKSYLESREDWIKEEGATLVLDDKSHGAKIVLYEAQMFDILDRLIGNAIKFKSIDTRIDLYIYQCDGWAVLEVRDRGIGMDVNSVKEALDLFGQINREKLEQQGGGLGLAIATRYVSLHGGRIEFENRKGGGTIVSVHLPLA